MNEPYSEAIPFETAERICCDLQSEKGVKFSQCWGACGSLKATIRRCVSAASQTTEGNKVNEGYGKQ